jgi:hypothetical protein
VNQWSTLDTTLKLRLLLALLAVKPAQMAAIQMETQQIVALTAEDSDGWVQTIGQIVSSSLVPENPHFNLSGFESNPETSSLLESIRSLVKEVTTIEFAPLEVAYKESPNFKPPPNIHFTVKKPTVRAERPKDLVTSSSDIAPVIPHARPSLALSTGIRNSSSNILSSSSGHTSGSLLSSGGPYKYSSSILSQTSRFEGRRPYVAPASAANTGLMIIDQVQVHNEKVQKAEEEKRQKEEEKKQKEDAKLQKRNAASAKKSKTGEASKAGQSAENADGKPTKKRKTAETHDPLQGHAVAPVQPDLANNERSGMEALLTAVQTSESAKSVQPPPPLSAPAPPPLHVTSRSVLPNNSGTNKPLSSFNVSAAGGLASLNHGAVLVKPTLAPSPANLTQPGNKPTLAPTQTQPQSATSDAAALLLNLDTAPSPAPSAPLNFHTPISSGPSAMPKLPAAPMGYTPNMNMIPGTPVLPPSLAVSMAPTLPNYGASGMATFSAAPYHPNIAALGAVGYNPNFLNSTMMMQMANMPTQMPQAPPSYPPQGAPPQGQNPNNN